MKKTYITTFFLLLVAFVGFAQQKKARPTTPIAKENQTPVISFGNNNAVYVNVDNPMTVSVEGVPNSELQVTCDDVNLNITNIEENKFIVRPYQAGEYTITITSKVDWRNTTYSVSAKPFPNPTPMLMMNNNGLRKGGEVSVTVFKGVTAMLAQIENFDFDAKCGIAEFSLTYIPKKGDPQVVENKGPMFAANVVALIQKCKPGDFYYFSNVKAKLPNDPDAKPINGTIAYYIK